MAELTPERVVRIDGARNLEASDAVDAGVIALGRVGANIAGRPVLKCAKPDRDYLYCLRLALSATTEH